MARSVAGSGREGRQFGIFSKYCLPILEFLIGKNFSDEITRNEVVDELRRLRISPKIGLSRAYGALESLRRAHLVRFKNVKASLLRDELAKKKRRIYELTLNGLVYVLSKKPDNWRKINEVAEKQPELFPPIFENWSSFSRFGVEEHIVSALSYTFKRGYELITVSWTPPRGKKYLKKTVWSKYDEEWIKRFQPRYLGKNTKEYGRLSSAEEEELGNLVAENEAELRRLITYTFFRGLLINPIYDPEKEKIIKALCSSPELCMLTEKVLKYFGLCDALSTAVVDALQKAMSGGSLSSEYEKTHKIWRDIDRVDSEIREAIAKVRREA